MNIRPFIRCTLKPLFYAASALTLMNGASSCATALGGTDTNGNNLGVPLSPAEKSAVETFFSKEINTDKVRKHQRSLDDPYRPLGAAACVMGKKHIYYFGDSGSGNTASDFGYFMHEMTHIWQNQVNYDFNSDVPGYMYTIIRGKAFHEYGKEEQGAIVEDYARTFLFKGTDRKPRFMKDTPENRQALMTLVEGRFPGARDLRLENAKSDCAPAPKIN